MNTQDINIVKEKLAQATTMAKDENVKEFLPLYDELGGMMSNSTQVFANSFGTISAMSKSKLEFIKAQVVSVFGVLGFLFGLLFLANTLENQTFITTTVNIICGIALGLYLKIKATDLWEIFKSYWVINQQENALIHSLAFNIKVANLLKPFVIFVETELLPSWEKRGIYKPDVQESPMEKFFREMRNMPVEIPENPCTEIEKEDNK